MTNTQSTSLKPVGLLAACKSQAICQRRSIKRRNALMYTSHAAVGCLRAYEVREEAGVVRWCVSVQHSGVQRDHDLHRRDFLGRFSSTDLDENAQGIPI